MRTKVQKWGNSLAVRIPKVFADQLGLEHESEVNLILEDDQIVIKAASKRYTLRNLLSHVREDNIPDEVSTGEPQGREVW